MEEKRKESAMNSKDFGSGQPKSVIMSRLGRGLGALIPPAPTQPLPKPVSKPFPDQAVDRTADGKAQTGLGQVVGASEVVGGVGVGGATTAAGATAAAGASGATRIAGVNDSTNSAPPSAPSRSTSQPESVQRSTGNTPSITVASGIAVVDLNISFIARNTRQPREKFDDRTISSLADSIRQHGLLQPIVVRKLPVPVRGKTYELIAGERRLRAFESLGKSHIPAIARDANEAQSAVFALIENVQREDLNPLERSKALQRLIIDFSWTQQQAAEKVGLDRATVANLLRLNDLDPFSAGCVREGRLTQGHAKALLAIDNVQARRVIAERALHDEWSVRQIEREVQRVKSASGLVALTASAPARRPSAQIGDLEKRLGMHLGSRVRLKKGRKSGTGTLSIQFFSLDQFDGILQKIGFNPNSLID